MSTIVEESTTKTTTGSELGVQPPIVTTTNQTPYPLVDSLPPKSSSSIDTNGQAAATTVITTTKTDGAATTTVINDPEYHRKYTQRTTADEVLKEVNLEGKTILITGASTGIGVETARSLALRGAHIVMANRNAELTKRIIDQIQKEATAITPEKRAKIDTIPLDLASLHSVKAAAETFIAKGWPLHVLILNAGVFAPASRRTIDNFETNFQVNYLSHFYLTKLLLPKLRESAPSRVVVVSSSMHTHTGISTALSAEAKVNKLIPPPNTNEFTYKLYGYSKLAEILFAFKLHHEEFKKSGIHTYVLHPGSMMATGIGRNFGVLGRIGNILLKPFTKTNQQGAATTVYCAASPDTADDSGKYYENCWDDERGLCVALAHDLAFQDELWRKSEQLIAKFEDTHANLPEPVELSRTF